MVVHLLVLYRGECNRPAVCFARFCRPISILCMVRSSWAWESYVDVRHFRLAHSFLRPLWIPPRLLPVKPQRTVSPTTAHICYAQESLASPCTSLPLLPQCPVRPTAMLALSQVQQPPRQAQALVVSRIVISWALSWWPFSSSAP